MNGRVARPICQSKIKYELEVSSGSYSTFLRGLNFISCLEMGYISNQTVIYDFTSAQWPAVAAIRWEELEVVDVYLRLMNHLQTLKSQGNAKMAVQTNFPACH